MERNIISAAILAACITSAHGVQIGWDVDSTRIQPVTIEAYHGETIDLTARLSVPTGASNATFLWQTNGMGNAWWQSQASCSASGVVTGRWTPEMDTGADNVKFFFAVVSSSGTSYRASGTIVLRRSPGSNPSSAELPSPGGTIDFSTVTVVNAPWATIESVDSAIAAATNAIVIPQPADTSGFVTMPEVDSAIATATNAIVIPECPDLTPYCTIESASRMVESVSNGLSAAISGIQIPSLAGYATEQYVRDAVASNAPNVDLSGYASKEYADMVASNAASGVQVPSLAGYATEQYVRDTVASNAPNVDLSGYASKEYADQAAATAASGVQIPSLEGYATEQSLSSTSSDLWNGIGEVSRRVDGIRRIYADGTSVTRVWDPNGWEFMDGTGCVWSVVLSYTTNWVSSGGVVYRPCEPSPGYQFEWRSSSIITNANGHYGVGVIGSYLYGSTYRYYSSVLGYGGDEYALAYGVSADAQSFTTTPSQDYPGMAGETYNIELEEVTNYVYKTRVAYTNDIQSSIVVPVGDGSSSLDPFVVKSLIESETGGTNTLAHTDENGFLRADYSNVAYTDMAGNSITSYYAPKQDTERLFTYVSGSNVYWSVTNYMRTVSGVIPSLELHEITNDVDRVVWSDTEKWSKFEGEIISNTIPSAVSAKADKAWSHHTSGTGADAPDGHTWVSTPYTTIAGGLEYQRTITSSGAIWILSSTGGPTTFGADSNGYFRISDDEGNTLFEISKTDAYEVGCNASGIAVSNDTITIPYNVIASQHPIISCCTDLLDADWKDEDESSCPFNVSWSGSSGEFVATVTSKSGTLPSAGFMRARYLVPGSTAIKHTAAATFDGGMYITVGGNQTRYRLVPKTINGELVLGLEAWQ